MLSSFMELLRRPLEAFGLVEPDWSRTTEKERELLRRLQERMREDVAVCQERSGFVTQLSNNSLELDGRWMYQLGSNDRFAVGEQVSFKVYKTPNNVVVKDVIAVVDKRQLVSKRVSGEVTQVDNNKFHISNGLVVDLSQVRADFLPMLSDHVSLEGDYRAGEDDEEEFDLNWSLFTVKRIVPTLSKLVTGAVTSFDPTTMKGMIGTDIVFHQSVCDKFVPAVGNRVVCNVIEGRYESGRWRAENVALNDTAIANKRHTFVVGRVPKFRVILGESKQVDLTLSNHGHYACQVVSVRISTSKSPSDEALETPLIPPQTTITWPVTVVGYKRGRCSVSLIWKIMLRGNRVQIIKSSLDYDTFDPNCEQEDVVVEESAKIVIPGQRPNRRPVFHKVPFKEYSVPQDLRDLIEQDNVATPDRQIALQKIVPALADGLTARNYGAWMHTMLFIEELADEESYKQLEDQGALFRSRGFICFSFPMDSQYSRVVCGDSINVRKPWEPASQYFKGHIWEVSATQLFCRFNAEFENTIRSGAQYNVTFHMSRSSFRRRHQAVDLVLKSIGEDWLFPSVCVEEEEPKQRFSLRNDLVWKNDQLNDQQKNAVKNILAKGNLPHPYVINGPPGTGKTMTIVELILQVYATEPDSRILVAAPTNSAVDTLGVRLMSYNLIPKEDFVRLSSYNAYTQGKIAVQLIDRSFVPNLCDQSYESAPLSDREPPPALNLPDLGKHRVSIGTLTTMSILNSVGLAPGYFTHLVIDEAGQCQEPDTLMPIALIDPMRTQIVLTGDPMQLGPTVNSQLAKMYNFHRSFLDRLSSTYLYKKKVDAFHRTCGYNPRLITRLVYNYRSLPQIVELVGGLFYDGDLMPVISSENSREADVLRRTTVANRSLGSPMNSLVFINVNSPDEQIDGSFSWFNSGEVLQILSILNTLYGQGVSPDDVGVITPYSLQVKKTYDLLDSMQIFSPKIGSVEQFQGQERDFIITSLVRNNVGASKQLSPFIADRQRVNVALSRAKVLNIIIGNKETLCNNALWVTIIGKCLVLQANSTATELP